MDRVNVTGHDYTITTLDVLQACDACAEMGMTYSATVQCTDCVVFSSDGFRWEFRTCSCGDNVRLSDFETQHIG